MAGLSVARQLTALMPSQREAWVSSLTAELLQQVARRDWWFVARPEQIEPPGDWTVWLLLCGRGFGKTRTGSEWLVEQAQKHPVDVDGHPTEWMIVTETTDDARRVCIEGPSGVRNVLNRLGIAHHYIKYPPTVTLEGGQIIHGRGADDADVGRGYNLAGLWADELAKWRMATETWTEGLLPALRTKTPTGLKPRAIVTTTPKPLQLLVEWTSRADGSVHVTRGSTFDNVENLSQDAVDEMRKRYAGSRIGRQELYAELLTDVEGALWNTRWLEDHRWATRDLQGRLRRPECVHIVVAVDPAVSVSETSDETGLLAVGRGKDGHDYVLADRSAKVVGFDAARRAWQLWIDVQADLLVYEENQGQDWVRDVLLDGWAKMQAEGKVPGGDAPLKAVRAKRGKRLRAEPVAARYEQGRVHHVGRFEKLEAQMVEWDPENDSGSPDRIDALVYAVQALRGGELSTGTVSSPTARASLPLPPGTTLVQPLAAPDTPDPTAGEVLADAQARSQAVIDALPAQRRRSGLSSARIR